MEYMLIETLTSYSLGIEINSLLKEGWELHGNTNVYLSPFNKVLIFMQPMIRQRDVS